MNANLKTAFAIAVLLILVPCALVHADLMRRSIDSPKQCPEGLTITSKATNGMMEFDVEVDTETIAHAGEQYRGRTRANAFLNIATSEHQIARINLHGSVEGRKTHYDFRISPSVAKSSELQLGVHLYEKGGRPTFGGGVTMQIHLAGFGQGTEATAEPK